MKGGNYNPEAVIEDGSCVMDWMQLGQDIDGELEDDFSGWSVSLSSDGTVVAIGAPGAMTGMVSASGHTRIYAWDGSSWNQRGGDIDGEAAMGSFRLQRLALLRRHHSRHWGVRTISTGMGVAQATPVFTRGTGAVGVNSEVTSTARRPMMIQAGAFLSPQTAPWSPLGRFVAMTGMVSASGHTRIYCVGWEQLESTW